MPEEAQPVPAALVGPQSSTPNSARTVERALPVPASQTGPIYSFANPAR